MVQDTGLHIPTVAELREKGMLPPNPPQYPKGDEPNNAIHLLGVLPHDREFPKAEDYKVFDAWIWKGHMHFKGEDGQWHKQDELWTGPKRTEHDYSFRILGVFEYATLPEPEGFENGDAWIWNEEIWVCRENVWVKDKELTEGLRPNIPSYRPGRRELDDLTARLLSEAPDSAWEDKGSMARELMDQRAEVKRLRMARIRYRCFFWGMILLTIIGVGLAGYAYVKRDLVIGRYSDERVCTLKVGNMTITGKRTYSYPSRSLWGQRWIVESDVQEVTTINLPGSRIDIVGDAEPKWWALRFTDGERGTQILKPALKYTFFTDKGIAMATYGGFCQPVDQQRIVDDPKNPERSIID